VYRERSRKPRALFFFVCKEREVKRRIKERLEE